MLTIKRFFGFWLGGLIGLVLWSLPTGAITGLLMSVSIASDGPSAGGMTPLRWMESGCLMLLVLACGLSLLFALGGLLSPGRQGRAGFVAMMTQCLKSCAILFVALSTFLGLTFWLLGLASKSGEGVSSVSAYGPWQFLATGLCVGMTLHTLVGVPLSLIKSVRGMNEPKPQPERKPAPPIAAP